MTIERRAAEAVVKVRPAGRLWIAFFGVGVSWSGTWLSITC
jgi:hypothetical protein